MANFILFDGDNNTYALLWQDDRDGDFELYGVLLNDSGQQIEGPYKVAPGCRQVGYARMACRGDKIGVVWENQKDDGTYVFNFLMQDYNGEEVLFQPVQNLKEGNPWPILPAIAASDEEFRVVWQEKSGDKNVITYINWDTMKGLPGEQQTYQDHEGSAAHPRIQWNGEYFLLVFDEHVYGADNSEKWPIYFAY